MNRKILIIASITIGSVGLFFLARKIIKNTTNKEKKTSKGSGSDSGSSESKPKYNPNNDLKSLEGYILGANVIYYPKEIQSIFNSLDDAELKIFMTASPEIRAQRRFLELTEKGNNVNFEEILENVKRRDEIDSTREISPLKKADDALVLDNSNLTREEQLDWVIEKVKELTLNYEG